MTEADTAIVIGGGTMGAGIAQCLLESGVAVAVVEPDRQRRHAARDRVADGLRRRYKARPEADAAVTAALERLALTEKPEPQPKATLVIEAVPENPAVKREVLALAEERFPGVLMASNTSSLSIDGLALHLSRPERFLGMHFFNPVPLSQLVELVVGSATVQVAIEEARGWVARLGKESIEVRDSPGFATSRLGVALGLEAIRMVEEGVASPADIDRGMVLGYRFPMGPLELTDVVGLDVRLAVARHLHETLGPRFEPPQLLVDKVAAGQVGKKAGQGLHLVSSLGLPCCPSPESNASGVRAGG